VPRFRFFSKKRGEHRTTSDLGARAALGVFFAVLVVAGGTILAQVVGRVTISEWRAKHEFAAAEAVVIDKQVVAASDEGYTKYRPEVTFRYSDGGRRYLVRGYDAAGVYMTDREDCEKLLTVFDVGGEYPCWYDPGASAAVCSLAPVAGAIGSPAAAAAALLAPVHRDRNLAVLDRDYSWAAWVLPLLPAAFVAVGIGGLIYLFLTWGKSAEHRALIQQATNLDIFDPHAPRRRDPALPPTDDGTNSPGTTLKFRIPPSAPGWDLMFLSAVCVGWNTLVGWFLYRVLVGHFEREGDYVLTIGIVPFVGVGGYLFYRAGRQLLIAGGVDPTVVEISDNPLYPGGTYELFVRQPGRLSFQRFSVALACDEEATFRQGTNSRTHVERVVENEVFRRDAFTADRQEPLTARFSFHVPDGAMHSFQSEHNAVKWKLVVRGELNHWPDFERSFSLVVYPGRNGAPHK
jgi:hypothetical protein